MRAILSISSLGALLPGCRKLPLLALTALLLCGCSTHKQSKTPADQAAQSQQTQESEASPEPSPTATPAHPSVTVHISYARRDDYMQSLSVTKFASATLIPSHGEKSGAVVMRFEGGDPVWEIAADRGVSGSLLGHMPGVEENKKFALTAVTYGEVPKHFARQEPENSDPEPLEPGKYYIFTVRRAYGPIGYQAVHITDDGTIEGYEAEPRAGTSYELCCNIASDFASPESGSADSPD